MNRLQPSGPAYINREREGERQNVGGRKGDKGQRSERETWRGEKHVESRRRKPGIHFLKIVNQFQDVLFLV